MSEVNGKPANVLDIEKMMEGFKPSQGNVSYASSVNILSAGNDFLLVFQRPRPGTLATGALAPFAIIENAEILGVSVKTAKDLHRALTEHLAGYERIYGKIETEYTRRLDDEAAHRRPQ